jgi:hypothetical protein
MKSSPNLTIANFILFGYVLMLLNSQYLSPIFHFPNLLVAVIYYSLLAVIYKKQEYLAFVFSSFIFLILFFAFIVFKRVSWETIRQTLYLGNRAMILYAYLLLPCMFMTYTMNFYLLSEELGRAGKKGLLRFFIPVLIKRELIFSRYNKIIEAFRIRGYKTETAFHKFRLLPSWIVPLIVTTLMEGAESYEYNRMLGTQIADYQPSRRAYHFSTTQKLICFLLLAGLVILMILPHV